MSSGEQPSESSTFAKALSDSAMECVNLTTAITKTAGMKADQVIVIVLATTPSSDGYHRWGITSSIDTPEPAQMMRDFGQVIIDFSADMALHFAADGKKVTPVTGNT